MNIFAINGSPRKTHNTATLLRQALDGARAGALAKGYAPETIHTNLFHLYEHTYTGCRSCFACKRLQSKTYGHCAIADGLQPILQELATADVLIIGSPIYFMDVSGQVRSFVERLLFPYLVYDAAHTSLAPKKPQTACIYTMNVTKDQYQSMAYDQVLSQLETFLGLAFTPPKTLHVYNTYQFDDYTKYKADIFSVAAKEEARKAQFPRDCQRAFALGQSLIV